MEREIKFRAWDGTKYITFDNHQYDLIYNDISGWNICPNLPNYKGEWTTGESSSSAKSFKLEQFTGLKDKNGVDIYEGDIVKWGHLSGSYEDPIRIAVVSINPDISFTLIPSVDPRQHVFHYGTFIYKKTELALEVIGNIHEPTPHNLI